MSYLSAGFIQAVRSECILDKILNLNLMADDDDH